MVWGAACGLVVTMAGTAETCWQRAPGSDDAYAKAFTGETRNGLGNTTPAGVAVNP